MKSSSATERDCGPALEGPDLRAVEGPEADEELAEFAKRKFPFLTVVVMSGKHPPPLPRGTYFLGKPYDPAQLLQVVLH